MKAGSLVSLNAVLASAVLIGMFLAVKIAAKFLGVWPFAIAFGFGQRNAMYTTLLMSTGLTFGTLSALYGLSNELISQDQYAILVTVVILSAVVQTVIAERWFDPGGTPAEEVLSQRATDRVAAQPEPPPRPLSFAAEEGGRRDAELLAESHGIRLTSHVMPGHVVETIVQFVKEHGFDVLVIGFMGHSRIFDHLWGGTSQNVTRLASCLVLVVK